jgi:hypothetical protein
MSDLHKLLARCKASVTLRVNAHRDIYESAEAYLIRAAEQNQDEPLAEPDVVEEMIERDTIIELLVYPDTPIGSYSIWHYDVDAAINEALECVENP